MLETTGNLNMEGFLLRVGIEKMFEFVSHKFHLTVLENYMAFIKIF